MKIGDKLYKPVADDVYFNASCWCNSHNAHIEDKGEYYQIVKNQPAPITIADYDNALEDHLTVTRVARGYTKREPSAYINSTNPRWKQDAEDWVAFLDSVMSYGLEIENQFIAGLPVPTLDEFKAGLPVITWTYVEGQVESSNIEENAEVEGETE